MSTLKVNSIQYTIGVDLLTPIQSGRAKAWVNFDGTFGSSPFTVSNGGIRNAFNVTSVTDNGTGDYTVTFDNAMPNANYAVATSHKEDETDTTAAGARTMIRRGPASFYSTTAVRVVNSNTTNGVGVDAIIFNVIIFGD